jgi:uncharacterized protein (TIGR03437 family)
MAYAQANGFRVTTFAGTYLNPGVPVAGTDLTLHTPIGLVRDSHGNFYIADYDNHRVLKTAPDGQTTVFAGTGTAGFTGNGGPATSAQLQFPRTLALDPDKYLYIGEPTINRIRRIDLNTGIIALVMGDGQNRFNGDNSGTATSVGEVLGMAVDSQGNLIVADTGNHRVRRLSFSDSRVTTIAGTGTSGFSGDGGPAISAQLNRPGAVAIHSSGDIYFSELGNGRVRRISSGNISTVAGLPTSSQRTGPALQVKIATCLGMTFNSSFSALYFTDEDSDTVRQLDLASAQVTLIAGTGSQSFSGDNGPATQAALYNPSHIAASLDSVFVADAGNNRVRKILLGGNITTFAGGKALSTGDGGPASLAKFNKISSIKFDPAGSMIVTDQGDCLIRRIDIAGRIVTLTGTIGTCSLPDLVSAVADAKGNVYWVSARGFFVRAPTDPPQGRQRSSLAFSDILMSKDGASLYVLDNAGSFARIWQIPTDSAMGTGTLQLGLWAGGSRGLGPDAGSQLGGFMFAPQALALDPAGRLCVSDSNPTGLLVRCMTGSQYTTAVKYPGFTPSPFGLAVDPSNRYLLTTSNYVLAFSGTGVLDGVAGNGQAGPPGNADNRLATFNNPLGVAVSADGTIYAADSGNQVIRRLAPVRATSLTALPSQSSAGVVPIRVLVADSANVPIGGIRVTFSATPATATLSSDTAISNAQGIASVNLSLTTGTAIVKAAVPDLGEISIDATTSGSGTGSGSGSANRPTVSAVISLSGFGGNQKIAPGGFVEIYGVKLAGETRQWSGDDFQNGVAPNKLGQSQVTMNGIPAFINLVSPTQINCMVPDGVAPGDVSIVVTDGTSSSDPFHVTSAARVPGLLAPASFRAGDKQYVAAFLPDQSFAGPDGLVPGAPFRPAVPGDTLVLYGVGFGAVTPPVAAGKISGEGSLLPNVQVTLGTVSAAVQYAGLTPGLVGLYQFNIVVPGGVTGDQPLVISVDGVAAEQQLWLSVK